MKHRHEVHSRKHRNTGGANEAAEDLKTKPERYNQSRVESEAEEKKRGGRAKRKHVGHVEGEHAKHHAGRKPRKNGGRTGSDSHPFTSARHGTVPAGRKVDDEME